MITCTFDHSTTNQFLPPRSFSIIAPTYYSSPPLPPRPNSFQPTPEMQEMRLSPNVSHRRHYAWISIALLCENPRETTSFQVSRLSNYPRSYVRSGGERRKLLLTRFRYLSFRLEKRKKKKQESFSFEFSMKSIFFFSFSN